MEDKASRLVIVPVTCFADWGDSLPLDVEECVTLRVLKAAMSSTPQPQRFIITPPQRFNPGRMGRSFFRMDADFAHQALQEICTCIHSYGFRKLLFLNSNPYCVDFVDTAGRDLRIGLGLQPFCINLNGIGLDFNSSSNRARIESIATGSDENNDSLTDAAAHLNALLEEVVSFRSLPNDGKIPLQSA